MTIDVIQPITRKLVPEGMRAAHADRLFGMHFPLRLEPAVFTMACRLSPSYGGGFWHFYALSNGGFYMAPQTGKAFRVVSENGFEGQLCADAMGITSCLYAYSHLSFCEEAMADTWSEHYHLLRTYMVAHGEAGAIMAAID